MTPIVPIHEVVGRNVTQYSDADDANLVSQLGPENLNRTVHAGEPTIIACGHNDSSLFDDVTSILSGN